MRARDLVLERELTQLAVASAGAPSDGGLGAFADRRARAGGIRLDLDPTRECAEELADARNYLVWGLERIQHRVRAGDPDVLDEHVCLLSALRAVVMAWRALHGQG